jgi:hypothetical protein
MSRCDGCGNEYDKCFTVTLGGATYTFDCFECAIGRLAPTCAACGCTIIGHGVENPEAIFCCAHCAAMKGVQGVRDRIPGADRPTKIGSEPMALIKRTTHQKRRVVRVHRIVVVPHRAATNPRRMAPRQPPKS